MRIKRQRAGDQLEPDEKEVAHAAHLRQTMLASGESPEITPAIKRYVQATLAYGMANVQTEFRPLARRNWTLIRKYGRRLGAMLAVLTLALFVLGLRAESASNEAADAGSQARGLAAIATQLSRENAARIREVQAIRRNAILSACRESNAHHHQAEGFVSQLIAHSTQPITPTEVRQRETLVPLFVEAIAPRCTQRQLKERLSRVEAPSARKAPARP